MRAALFITCVNDTLFPQTGRAAVAVLERVGVEVDFPLEQTCCGQMHVNSGYGHEAIGLVRRFVRVFGEAEAVVTPSGSCAATVREGYERMAIEADDEPLAAEVRALAPRVFELSEFLVGQLGVEDVGAAFPHRVTYHPTCHSLRLLKVGDAPVRLLRGPRRSARPGVRRARGAPARHTGRPAVAARSCWSSSRTTGSARASSTRSTAPSRAARSPSRRPAPSSWTAVSARAGAR